MTPPRPRPDGSRTVQVRILPIQEEPSPFALGDSIGCPWLSSPHEAGSPEYAAQSAAFLSEAFGGKWIVCKTANGWHYADEILSAFNQQKQTT